jgi:hypothetical protein
MYNNYALFYLGCADRIVIILSLKSGFYDLVRSRQEKWVRKNEYKPS